MNKNPLTKIGVHKDQINGGEGKVLLYTRMPINRCRRNKGSRESPLGSHHNTSRQERAKDTKITGGKFDEKPGYL